MWYLRSGAIMNHGAGMTSAMYGNETEVSEIAAVLFVVQSQLLDFGFDTHRSWNSLCYFHIPCISVKLGPTWKTAKLQCDSRPSQSVNLGSHSNFA